jgi:hypothetical protein
VGEPGAIRDLEGPQRAFTKKIWGCRDLSYWNRLEQLSLLSIQRRCERYMIMYTFKMLHGLVPNLGISEATSRDTRLGRQLVVPKLKGREAVKTIRDRSLVCEGPRLFNILPRDLRDMDSSFDSFKWRLDKWLENVPDHPRVEDAVPEACDKHGRPSNSLFDWQSGSHSAGLIVLC